MSNVDNYMQGINDYLVSKYGQVKPEWGATLMLLKDSLIRYNQIKEILETEGLFDSNTYKKNPLITSEKDLIATINKITQKLGITPYDAAKIKMEDTEDDAEFIESLTNE